MLRGSSPSKKQRELLEVRVLVGEEAHPHYKPFLDKVQQPYG